MRISIFAACAAALGLAGCATITKGTTQSIVIQTPGAPGAQSTLIGGGAGSKVVTTPATLVVDKSSDNITVTCRKECFQDGIGVITSNTETMAAGNIIAGGVIGLGIDAASGALHRYNGETQIAMVVIAGCKPRA